ncbi:HAD-IA family hydrolase [Phenylobacterium sp.]|jgi:phosphoglycolate phosphatase|uniref:HAD-IA family hydrolase n=1 Tax=Phenylobacterium sp. TaxID=1871053 RepID=UPI0037831D6F
MTADLSALAGATIAFDLDGTLVESAPDLVGTLNWLLAAEGLAPLPYADARQFIGKGARWLIERGFAEAGAAPPGDRMPLLFERFIAHYHAHIADESHPYPGMVEALETLRAHGARLCVCTNKLTGLSLSLLDALDLTRLFDSVTGADAAPAPKPDRRHLEAAVAAAGGDIARTIMVGDAAPDAGAARAAGAGLILVSFGYTEIPAHELGPDILIDHYDALPAACVDLLVRRRMVDATGIEPVTPSV